MTPKKFPHLKNLLKKLFREFKVLSELIHKSSDVNMEKFLKLEERVEVASQKLMRRIETIEHEQIRLKTQQEDQSSRIQKLEKTNERKSKFESEISVKDEIGRYKSWILETETSQIRSQGYSEN